MPNLHRPVRLAKKSTFWPSDLLVTKQHFVANLPATKFSSLCSANIDFSRAVCCASADARLDCHRSCLERLLQQSSVKKVDQATCQRPKQVRLAQKKASHCLQAHLWTTASWTLPISIVRVQLPQFKPHMQRDVAINCPSAECCLSGLQI